jgi:hypothetical protein
VAARSLGFFAMLTFALAMIARPALAQRVLLVEPSRDDRTLSEAFNRLRAELSLQEFEITVIAASERVSPATLEAEARRAGAFSGILLARSEGGATAEVCIADRVTGKTSQRRLAISDVEEAPRVLAVRAVDLLRSSLRELDSGERPPPDVMGVQSEPVAPRIHAWSAPPERFRLHVAGTALGAGSELGPAFGGSLGVSYRPAPWLAAGLLFAGPFLGARYDFSVGTAVVRQELLLTSLSVNVFPEERVELGPSFGAGVYHLQAQGEVDAPLRSRSGDVFCFAASLGVEAGVHLTSALVVSGSLAALLLTPRPVVAVDVNQVTVAAPVTLASLGMGVTF